MLKAPSDWCASPLKHADSFSTDSLAESTNPEFTFRYVDISSVKNELGIERYTDMSFSESPSRARKIVHAGDTIVSTVRTYLKAIALVRDSENVIVSTGFAVIRPKRHTPSYLYYLCSSELFCQEVNKRAWGIAYPAISEKLMGEIMVPIPPVNEQQAIASLLDKKCAKIDKVVAKLKKQAAILERYRTSVIHEALTQGLDPTAPTKPSGIDWIGDIPESWKVYRLKFFAVSDLGLMLDEKQMTNVNVHEYLANKDIQWFSINETELSEASFPLGSEQRYQIMDGDILICEGGEVGRCAVWHGPSPHFYYQKAIHRLRVDKSIANPDFIAYQFFDKAKTTNFVEVRKGVSTIAHLPGDQLMRLKFTVPPLEEQNAIADYLDARTATIDAVLETKRKQLDILKRRRQSLIYEYVTGKRRVTEEA